MTSRTLELGRSPTRCPYCHAPVVTEAEPWVACVGCLARHHDACWDEAGACASCGCSESLMRSDSTKSVLREAEAPAPLVGSTVRVERVLGGGARLTYPAFRGTAGNGPAAWLFLTGVVAALFGGLLLGVLTELGCGVAAAAAIALSPALGLLIGAAALGLSAPPLASLELLPNELVLRTVAGVRAGPLTVRVARAAVGNVALAGSGPHGVLLVDFGAQRVAAAGHPLTAPEQEWLRGVVSRWRNGG